MRETDSPPSVSCTDVDCMHHCPFAAHPSSSHVGSSCDDSVVLESDSLDELSAGGLVVALSVDPPVLDVSPVPELDVAVSELELGSPALPLELELGSGLVAPALSSPQAHANITPNHRDPVQAFFGIPITDPSTPSM